MLIVYCGGATSDRRSRKSGAANPSRSVKAAGDSDSRTNLVVPASPRLLCIISIHSSKSRPPRQENHLPPCLSLERSSPPPLVSLCRQVSLLVGSERDNQLTVSSFTARPMAPFFAAGMSSQIFHMDLRMFDSLVSLRVTGSRRALDIHRQYLCRWRWFRN